MKLAAAVLAITLSMSALAAFEQTPKAPQIRDVASGDGSILAVKADGTVVGWGRNDNSRSVQPDAPRASVASPM